VRSKSHEFYVLGRAVLALAVHNRSLEHVAELGSRAEEIGPHKVNHTPVFQEVVLQRITGQHHATPASGIIIK